MIDDVIILSRMIFIWHFFQNLIYEYHFVMLSSSATSHKGLGYDRFARLSIFLVLADSYNSIKRTCSIKRPGLEFFKKSLLNDQYDLKNEVLNS